jgi:hypothetical protein
MLVAKRMKAVWFEIGALVVLVALWVWSCAGRIWRQGKGRGELPTMPGHGFDTKEVKQRLECLRQDPGSIAALRRRNAPGHDFFVAAVRHSLSQLSYFRSTQKQDAKVTEHESRQDCP